MKVRADFSQKFMVRPSDGEWVPSPQKGVDRLMLDRIGEEIARATSLVRFAPGSFFPHHVHGGGEEFFVLEGQLEDENGRYPAGTYLRDPVGSQHTPFTKEGCTIFVKLWQFDPDDRERKVIDTNAGAWEKGAAEGCAVKPLHAFAGVSTFLLRLAPGAGMSRMLNTEGEEILVLDGSFRDDEGEYPKRTWIREPGGREHKIASDAGCILLVKTGHLSEKHLPREILQELERAGS